MGNIARIVDLQETVARVVGVCIFEIVQSDSFEGRSSSVVFSDDESQPLGRSDNQSTMGMRSSCVSGVSMIYSCVSGVSMRFGSGGIGEIVRVITPGNIILPRAESDMRKRA